MRSNDVGRGMPSSPWGSTNGRTTSGVASHHRLLTAHTVKERRAWHAIIAFRLQTQSNDIENGMTSPPFDSTHGQTMSSVACHHHLWTSSHSRTTSCLTFNHRLWAAHTIERRRAWHDITALGQHTRSNDVERDMPSPPLDSTHDQTTSCMA